MLASRVGSGPRRSISRVAVSSSDFGRHEISHLVYSRPCRRVWAAAVADPGLLSAPRAGLLPWWLIRERPLEVHKVRPTRTHALFLHGDNPWNPEQLAEATDVLLAAALKTISLTT